MRKRDLALSAGIGAAAALVTAGLVVGYVLFVWRDRE